MKYGIDVSKWNGVIDWAKVKSSGMAFAVLKVTKKNNEPEEAFERNYAGASAQGLVLGAYRYVYAKTAETAKAEAEAAVKVLAGRKLAFRVWLDMEDSSIKTLGKQNLTELIETEAQIFRAAGYEVGIYCNADWYKNVLDSQTLKQTFPFWIARYGKNNGEMQETNSPEDYAIAWQYTSKGTCDGVNGNVDLNVAFSEIETAPQMPENYAYKVGQTVYYSSYYDAAGADISEAKFTGAAYRKGTVTAVVIGARNPYRIGGESIYLNDGDIRGLFSAAEEEKVYHMVKAGENLTVIARKYGTTVNAVLRLNPSIKNKNVIKPKQKIRVK